MGISGVDNDPEDDFVAFQILNATQAKIVGDYELADVAKTTVAMTDNTNFGKDADYFVSFDADSEDLIINLSTGGAMTWVFDTDSSFKATVDGDVSQVAAGLLDRDSVTASDVTTAAGTTTGTKVTVEMQDWSDDDDITETYGLLLVNETSAKVTDYAAVTSSTGTVASSDEITFDACSCKWVLCR